MRRPYTMRDYAEFAHDAVRQVPGLCLGTDIIVGFPGETDAIFTACRDTLAALPLAYFHVFTFSPRPGTSAALLPGRVQGDIAKRRQKELESLSREKAEAFVRSRLGQTVEVLTERRRKEDPPHGTSGEFLEVTLTGVPAELPANTRVTARLTAATGNRSAVAEFVKHILNDGARIGKPGLTRAWRRTSHAGDVGDRGDMEDAAAREGRTAKRRGGPK